MCAVARRIITRTELIRKKVITLDAVLPGSTGNYILLKGVVYTPEGHVLPHAAIDIIQTNSNMVPPITKKVGITFSLEDGSYGVSLLWGKGYSYELVVYSP